MTQLPLRDVDDAKLDEVNVLLGATAIKATVNGASDEVILLAARRRALLDPGVMAGGSDLAEGEARRSAWA